MDGDLRDDGYPVGRDANRVAKWLMYYGRDTGYVSPAAARLLAARLAIRVRAGWIEASILVLALVLFWEFPGTDGPTVVLCLAGAGAVVVYRWIVVRGERSIAFRLPVRATLERRASLSSSVGRLAIAHAVVAAALAVTFVVTIVRAKASALDLTAYLLAVGVLAGTASSLVITVARNRRLAIDSATLLIDKRLRTQDSILAIAPCTFFIQPLALIAVNSHGPKSLTLVLMLVSPLVASIFQAALAAAYRRRANEPPWTWPTVEVAR